MGPVCADCACADANDRPAWVCTRSQGMATKLQVHLPQGFSDAESNIVVKPNINIPNMPDSRLQLFLSSKQLPQLMFSQDLFVERS